MMDKDNGNGKWQLAFWIISVIAGTWLSVLSTNVIANDRLRTAGDERLSDKIETLLKENNSSHERILMKLSTLEAILGNGRN